MQLAGSWLIGVALGSIVLAARPRLIVSRDGCESSGRLTCLPSTGAAKELALARRWIGSLLMVLDLDWSSAVAKPGDDDRLTVTIPLTGEPDAKWREAWDERVRQFGAAAPVSHWTVRLSSNDRVVIAEGLSPGGETQLKEELGKLFVDINADVDALSARQQDEKQRASEKRVQIEAAADEMTRRLRGEN